MIRLALRRLHLIPLSVMLAASSADAQPRQPHTNLKRYAAFTDAELAKVDRGPEQDAMEKLAGPAKGHRKLRDR